MAKHWWIVVGVAVICLLGGMIARSIARSKSGLDRKEMAVARRAARSPFVFSGLGLILFPGLGLILFSLVCFSYYKHRAAVKKVVGFDPREQNRAEGVIYHFYELRITRTELIKGYGTGALRIPLQGLTATVTKTDTVDITIKGPDTKFVYSMPFDVLAGFNPWRARQFAALLNYEAGLLGAPQKMVQEKLPTTSGAPATDAHEECTKVRCLHCQHVQTVPVSQETFSCEQCNAHLKRRTAPANSS
ncbi:MAG: hypothetical protein ACRDUT_03475 [Mycobacterium sp.]